MKKVTPETKKTVTRSLLGWYKKNKRSLPWRETHDPYHIWIAEIMLQQTQVDTIIPYYHRFLSIFPTVEVLADADQEDVLKAWENMGYYSRARNLHRAACMIVENFRCKVPDSRENLMQLPGIGTYTAGAILSIAYKRSVPAVDGNVRRIMSRLFAIRERLNNPRTQKNLYDLAAALVPANHPGDFNQALMDLGATICKAKNPACVLCPLTNHCKARILDLQNALPLSAIRPTPPRRQAAAAFIHNADGRILVVQRPATGLLASLWKLPGGFIQEAVTAEDDLKKAVHEELGIRIRTGRHLASVDHAYTHFRLTLQAYEGSISEGTPRALGCQAWRWVIPDEFKMLPASKIDRMITEALF